MNHPHWTGFALLCTILVLVLFSTTASAEIAFNSCNYTADDLSALRHQTETMFRHAFDSYMQNAFPRDELRPLTCAGDDTFGGVTVSLIDTLDTLLVFRDWPAFVSAVKYLRDNLSFDLNTTVSVFEITIRVLGGLISAHGFLTDAYVGTGFDPGFWYPTYDDALLRLAVDLADRLMPVFDTPTGIPYGAVHLQFGVSPSESLVASTAGAGSLILEFGTLTRYTGDTRYYNAAFNALSALHKRAASTGLVGNHIDITTGDWVATDAGVGALIDSYYEYMLKGYILFGDIRLWDMYEASYNAIQAHIYKRPWYFDVDMWTGQITNVYQSSLAAFFPGLQVLAGHLRPAIETTRAHYSIWRKFGCLPEGFNVQAAKPVTGRVNYPLRPELVEGIFYLHWATNDTMWIGAAANMLHSIEVVSRVPCGYAEIKNVAVLKKGDLMPSFTMSETLKYLYLIFSADLSGMSHWLRSGSFVFTTEAHPLRIAVDEFSQMIPESVSQVKAADARHSLGIHRVKCPRRPKWEKMLTCGYAMAGTDYPKFDRNSARSEPLAKDVEMQVNAYMHKFGANALKTGMVFMGSRSAYRVLKIIGLEIFFSKLREDEYSLLLQQLECPRVLLRNILRQTCHIGSSLGLS